MQYFDINLAPGAVREINVQGSFVYFLNGSAGGADTTIELRAVSGSDTVLLKPGQAFRLGASNNQRWVVANHAGQGTIIGQLLMGDGDFSDNRISGSVEVIDGGKTRTLANMAFLGYVNMTAAAGLYATNQLLNPAGSGKNVVLEKMYIGSGTAQDVLISLYDTPLTAYTAPNAYSKMSGGADSVAQLRADNLAGRVGKFIFDQSMSAGMNQVVEVREPIVLKPGSGVTVQAGNLNATAQVTFEFYEEGAA